MKNFNTFLTELYLIEGLQDLRNLLGIKHKPEQPYKVRDYSGRLIDSHSTEAGAKEIANNVVNKGQFKVARVHGPNLNVVHDTSTGKFLLHKGGKPSEQDSLISVHNTPEEAVKATKDFRSAARLPENRKESLSIPHFHVQDSSGKVLHSTLDDMPAKRVPDEPSLKSTQRKVPIVAPEKPAVYPRKEGGEVYKLPVTSDQSKGRTHSVHPFAPGTPAPETELSAVKHTGAVTKKPEKQYLNAPELTTGNRRAMEFGSKDLVGGPKLGQGRHTPAQKELIKTQVAKDITKLPTETVHVKIKKNPEEIEAENKANVKAGNKVDVDPHKIVSSQQKIHTTGPGPMSKEQMKKVGYPIQRMGGEDTTWSFKNEKGETVDTGYRMATAIHPEYQHLFGGHNTHNFKTGHSWTREISEKPEGITSWMKDDGPYTLHHHETGEQIGQSIGHIGYARQHAKEIAGGSHEHARVTNQENLMNRIVKVSKGRDPGPAAEKLSGHHVVIKNKEGKVVGHTDPDKQHLFSKPEPSKTILNVNKQLKTDKKGIIRVGALNPENVQRRTGSETGTPGKSWNQGLGHDPVIAGARSSSSKPIRFRSEEPPKKPEEKKIPKGKPSPHAGRAQNLEGRAPHTESPEPAKQTLAQRAIDYMVKARKK